MNSVRSLKENPFNLRQQSEKKEILKLGRPTPILDLIQVQVTKNRTFTRKFKASLYDVNEWICGCDVVNAFFCFPCLLFGEDRPKAWTETGLRELGHFAQCIRKHQNTASHLDNEATWCVLKSSDVMRKMDVREGAGSESEVAKRNDKVRTNRYVVSKMIDCIKFCGAHELATLDRGLFNDLVDFTAELDGALRDHLHRVTLSRKTSVEFCNDIIECIFKATRENIAKEINNTEFISIICDDVSDLSLFQKALFLRYIVNEKIVERFWGFLNPPEDNATSLAEVILNAIKPLFPPEKLISQSYDGATNIKEVGSLVKAVYPNAHLVHCYAHDLNAVIQQAASLRSQPIRIFFANLLTIPEFFAEPRHNKLLNDIVGVQHQSFDGTELVTERWNYQTRTVNTVHTNLGQLLKCMETIEGRSLQETTLNQASSIRRQLQDSDFLFWLDVFHHLMPHVDILDNVLQNNPKVKNLDNAVDKFSQAVSYVKSDVEVIVKEASVSPFVVEERRKRHRVGGDVESQTETAKKVCDVMVEHVKERFDFKGYIPATRLLLTSNFKEYDREFPEDDFNVVVKEYPLDPARLKIELRVMYRREDFQNMQRWMHRLHSYIHLSNLDSVLTEVWRLLKIVLTTPSVCPENDALLSTPVKLKKFLRHAEDRATERLAVLALEKELMGEMADLNNQVIDRFAAMKKRTVELVFQ